MRATRAAMLMVAAGCGSSAPPAAPAPASGPVPPQASVEPRPVDAGVDAASAADAGAAQVTIGPLEPGAVVTAQVLNNDRLEHLRRPGDGRSRVSLVFGAITVTPALLGPSVVHDYLVRNRSRLRYCYEKTLRLGTNANLAGTVTAQIVVATTGKVHDAKATGLDETIDRCVERTLDFSELPKLSGTDEVVVSFTLTCAPG